LILNSKTKVKDVSGEVILRAKGGGFKLIPSNCSYWRGEQFARNELIGNSLSSLSFYKRKNGEIEIRVWSKNVNKRQWESVTRNCFEEAKLMKIDDDPIVLEDNVIGALSRFERQSYFPMKIRGKKRDEGYERSGTVEREIPNETILSVLSSIKGRWLIQVLYEKAHPRWNSYFFKDTVLGFSGPWVVVKKLKEKEGRLSKELLEDMKTKFKSNKHYRVQVKVLGTATKKKILKSGVDIIRSALKQFNYRNKKGNRINLIPVQAKNKNIESGEKVDKIERFIDKVKNKDWYYTSWWDKSKRNGLLRKHSDVLSAEEFRWFLDLPTSRLENYNIRTRDMKLRTKSEKMRRRERKNQRKDDLSLLGKDENENNIYLNRPDLHTFVAGKTGVGKSTLILRQVLDKVKKGIGTIVIDPHSDLTRDIISGLPEEKIKDVIYIGPDTHLGFNALDVPEVSNIDYIKLTEYEERKLERNTNFLIESAVESLSSAIKDHFGEHSWGARMESLLSNFTLELIKIDGSNIIDLYHLITDEKEGSKFAAKTGNENFKRFFNTERDYLDKHDYISTLDKIGKIQRSDFLRQKLCIRNPPLKIHNLLEEGKIVLVNLGQGIDKEKANFFASVLVNQLYLSVRQRSKVEESKRGKNFLVVDEFQRLNNKVFAEILSEGRKYGLMTLLSSQYVDQIDKEIWDAIDGNAGSVISFAVGNQSASKLYEIFGGEDSNLEKREFTHLNKYNILYDPTGADRVVRAKTLPKPEIQDHVDVEARIRRVTRNMNEKMPDHEYRYQQAEIPLWSTDERDLWNILIGVWNKHIKLGKPPSLSRLKEDIKVNNLKAKIQKYKEKGYFDTSKGKKTYELTNKARDKITELIGRSHRAGGKEHKRKILQLYEFLTAKAFNVKIMRQDKNGKIPDFIIQSNTTTKLDNGSNISLKWKGCQCEVEHSTTTKPVHILKNLAKGINIGKRVIFFVDNKQRAKRLIDIISYPYTKEDGCYTDENGEPFDPNVEFDYKYWKSSNDFDISEKFDVFIFTDKKIYQYTKERGKSPRYLQYRTPNRKGYLINKIEKEPETSINEKQDHKSENIDTFRKEYFEYKENGEKDKLDKIKSEHSDIFEILEQEFFCSEILNNKTMQPEIMEQDLTRSTAYDGLIYTVEGLYAYAKSPEHGYRLPQKPVTTVDLKDSLSEFSSVKIPSDFGNKIASFLNTWSVPKEKNSEKNQFEYDLSEFIELFTSLYKLYILKVVGEGSKTYPVIYDVTNGIVGRYTVQKLFSSYRQEIAGKNINIYEIELSSSEKLLKTIMKGENKVRKDRLIKKTDITQKDLDTILKGVWYNKENEEYQVKSFKTKLEKTLK